MSDTFWEKVLRSLTVHIKDIECWNPSDKRTLTEHNHQCDEGTVRSDSRRHAALALSHEMSTHVRTCQGVHTALLQVGQTGINPHV